MISPFPVNKFSNPLFATPKTRESSECPHVPLTTKPSLLPRPRHTLCRSIIRLGLHVPLSPSCFCLATLLLSGCPSTGAKEKNHSHSELGTWLWVSRQHTSMRSGVQIPTPKEVTVESAPDPSDGMYCTYSTEWRCVYLRSDYLPEVKGSSKGRDEKGRLKR